MLDILRKKAQSWVTYVLFGSIIVSFALFFGYNKMERMGGHDVVATVNGVPISQGEYDFAFDNNEAYYRQIFKDQMPEKFVEGLRQSTLQQLISRKLLVAVAARQGFVVTDPELAAHIQTLPFLKNKDEQFDPLAYREQFLPAIAQQYHVNFEVWARESLLAERVRTAIAASIHLSDDELKDAYTREHTRYTFEVVRLDADRLVQEKKIADVAAAKDAAVSVHEVMDNDTARKPLLTTYGITPETVGPLTVQLQIPFLGPTVPPATTRAIFALSDGESCPAGPYQIDKNWVTCRLLKRETPTAEEWSTAAADARKSMEERTQQVVMDQWMQALSSDATISRSL